MAPSVETQAEPNTQQEGEEEAYYAYANNLALSVVLPMALRTAVELDVFNIIAKAGPGAKLSPSEIATQIPTTNPNAANMLDRILRLLASYRVLDCSLNSGRERLYGISRVSKYFVSNEDGVSLAPFLVLPLQRVFLKSWPKLKDAIMEGGIPFNMVHGMHLFEYAAANPKFNEVYNNALFNSTTIVMKKTLESYKGFEQFKQLVDVGGGLGMTLSLFYDAGVEHLSGDMFQCVPTGDAIILKSVLNCWDDNNCIRLLKNCYKEIPEDGKVIVINGVLPLEPETSEAARDISLLHARLMIRDDGATERTKEEYMALATGSGFKGVEHVGGDMFQSIPKGDAIFMKWILHCWDDDHCLRLLKNCYEAIPNDGKVIVLNAVISELPETSDAARETSLLDVLLLTRDSGGKERTKREFIALATGAGFKGINFVCYQCNFHVMEFFK
ncbi:hypothetical protein Ddye_017428 [Dipteronia dyeriana]|uniref:Uncharacterized protein n=1 Tax=Dipteronia dyeriana TaxID=168575 RepID=A0AAD9U9J4_9ROSI|nr:hypothetical protein Ddye_017428 [Dipteronia dyeriana]